MSKDKRGECVPAQGIDTFAFSLFLLSLGPLLIGQCLLPTLKAELPHLIHSDSYTTLLWKHSHRPIQNNALLDFQVFLNPVKVTPTNKDDKQHSCARHVISIQLHFCSQHSYSEKLNKSFNPFYLPCYRLEFASKRNLSEAGRIEVRGGQDGTILKKYRSQMCHDFLRTF